MLGLLLAKDLRRARRNPLPWLMSLIVPLAITALVGLVFGGQSDSGALGRIRFAVVDEDKTVLSDFLRGAANQGEGGKYLEPVFMEREDALRQINDNKISAVLIIPTNFMRNYLTGREAVSLELIKNPAESIHPAVLEELLGAVVTALNAVSRNFNSEFPEWQAVIEGRDDYHKVSELIDRAGDKLKMVKKYINPPLVSYEKEGPADEAAGVEGKSGAANGGASKSGASKNAPAKTAGAKAGSADDIFAFLLIGMSALFLLFLAGNAMSDLYRELSQRTFQRYQTMRDSLVPFLASKAVFAFVMLLLGSAIMLAGGRARPSERYLRAGQSLDGGLGRLLVAAGNRAARAQDHCAVPADRLGHAGAASTDQLRQRFQRRADSAGGVAGVRRGRECSGRAVFQELMSG